MTQQVFIEIDEDVQEKKFLARVVTSPPHYGSLYVESPGVSENTFHTDPNHTINTEQVSYYKDLSEFEVDEYVYLVYKKKPEFLSDGYYLDRVKNASFTEPSEIGETFGKKGFPKTCPSCGEEASVAIIEDYTSYDTAIDEDNADICRPNDERCRWHDIHESTMFIH